MRMRLSPIVASLLAAGLFPGLVEGQLVEVGRGYVRAPFVRIQRRGGQRARVSAPFVDYGGNPTTPVYATPPGQPTPGPAAESLPIAVAPSGSAAIDVMQMDESSLKQAIVDGEAKLSRELDQVASGDHWRRSLHVGRLHELLAEEQPGSQTEERREQLQPILDAYHQALINPSDRFITQLDGFQSVQPALRMLLFSPTERSRERLIVAARELEAELGTMQHGASWVRHLRLPDSLEQGRAVAQSDRDALTALLARFDAASSDPRNRPVTGLQAFQTMHQQLSDSIALLDEPIAPAADRVAADEVIIIRQRTDHAPTPVNPQATR